ncbi:MAG TPA: two-component regulator propeller domain-containing protein [Bacteroidales bacterium]|nr:two-component regulator propeller domain-containing protein [Bacteroidales bacterium]
MKIGFWSVIAEVIRNFSLMTLFFILPPGMLEAQTFFFERYGVEHGLSSSKVYTVIQDRNDWIWLGTESGVSRFDGTRFENFTFADGLAPGGAYSIAEDKTGRIWFGHLNGGLSIFDGEKFNRVRFDSIQVKGDVTSIKPLDDNIWITTISNGAIKFALPEAGDTLLHAKQYSGKEGLSDQISSSYLGRDNSFYCVDPNFGIKKYNPEKDIFEMFTLPGYPKYFSVITLFEDSHGDFWLGTYNGGLYRYMKNADTMVVYDHRDGLAKNHVSFITEDYRGSIWVGTYGGGITVFSGDNMKVFNESNGLQALTIHWITEDKEKNILIADHLTGLSIFKGDHFVTFSDESVLPDEGVYAIEEDPAGRYWFGTNAGISVYDPDAPATRQVTMYDNRKNAIGKEIRFIKSDGRQKIWIGTNGNGLSYYDLDLNRFIYNSYLNSRLDPFGIIRALEIDKEGRLWIGNQDRLIVWDGSKEETYTQSSGLAGNSITALFCDDQNNIWIGSENRSGLTKYERTTGKFRIIDIGEGYIPTTITQTEDSRIWIGTVSGLLAIEKDTIALVLNEQSGLLSNNIKLLQPGGDHFLYIGTSAGLNRYNMTDSTIASFTKRNGFPGIEAMPNATMADRAGNLWFGTVKGVTRLTPSKMPPVDARPQTHLSRMDVNYVPHEMQAGLKLNHRQKSLAFNYYSVSLTDPEAVRYRVMLKGADKEWSPPSRMTMEDYPNLAPGHYTFSVIASNSYGYWNEDPVEYAFIIKPPFYQTSWFIASVLLLAALGVILYIKVREKNLIREKRILEQKVEERTAEVVMKSAEIEEKNRDITASIRYAERIQRAMLPRPDTFKDTFVLYMPKDIVSGDFYWMHETDELELIAACDCTGHGVPGAFMSIIGHNSLNKVVMEYGITEPGAILDLLNAEVVKALMQRHEETINDGMDMALIAFNKKTLTLQYAGAYNPVYVVRKGELFTYKGDRFPIGMSSQLSKKNFTTQWIEIEPGDMIYMSSDGYADQFGARDGKKYKSGNVKKLLCEIWELPVCEQRDKLRQEILDWKGDLPQVDDIMFVGTRIPGL